jgi:putative transposase
MVRGIEKRHIFEDDRDREDFLRRLEEILEQCQATCFAWVLIPSHVHLLLRTGPLPLEKIMRRLLTGYAVKFNRRHQRSGHLFQNRYRSVICDEESYLLELVRYIHLNGIRAGLVKGMEGLDRYRWSGHSAVMGIHKRSWQATDEVLSHFGKREQPAKRKYRQFMSEGIQLGKRKDLVPEIGDGNKENDNGRKSVDSRILGCDSFAEKVLARVGGSERHLLFQKSNQIELEGLIGVSAEELGVTSEEIRGESRRRDTSRARSVLCWACMTQFGVSGKRLSSILGMTPSAVYLASLRGEACVNHNPDLKKSIGNYLNNIRTSL